MASGALQDCARDLLVRWMVIRRVVSTSRQLQRADDDFEEMQRAQIFQQLGDACVWIGQLNAR